MTIYLDNASTSFPKPPGVEKAMSRFLVQQAGNPGRAGHRMAAAAERMVDQLRSRLVRMFEADDPGRIAFAMNATDALNMAIKGTVQPGDHVITTALEHNSVSRPLQGLAGAGTIELTRLPLTGDGFIDPDAVAAAFQPNTRLVACTHCSNVLGTIQPIADIGRITRERDAILLIDAAQSAGVLPISMREMHIDLLAVTGHKSLLGPTGTGALLVGSRAAPRPWREGGTGADSVHPVQPETFPHRLEAGTPNSVGLAGLLAGLDEVEQRTLGAILDHERSLVTRLRNALLDDDRFRVFGSADAARRAGVLSFTLKGFEPQEIASILDESFDIAVRAGLHCAPYVHAALGTAPAGTTRVSVGPYNTPDEIDALVAALKQIADSALAE